MVFPNAFNKSLIKCENWKLPETQVFLPPPWSRLSNSRISKFFHFSYLIIVSHSFKTLLPLLGLSHPIISKFYQLFTMDFFRSGNPSFYFLVFLFLEIIDKSYILSIMSIIITIVSNITVLVSQKIVFFGFLCLWAMVSIRRLIQSASSNLPFSFQILTRIVCCLTKNACSIFYCCDLVIC